MGGDHVREPDHRRQALRLLGVMPLDRLGDPRVHPPAASEHTSDKGVVDAESAAFLVDSIIRGGATTIEPLGIARVEAGQHRAADVVQDRGEGELVAVADARGLGDPVGAPLHRECVQAEAVGLQGESPVAIEDVVGGGGAKHSLDRAGPEALDRVRDAADPRAALELPGGADDRAGEPDICLDHRGDVVRRGAPRDQLESLVTGLEQGRLALGLVKGGGENAPAALPSRSRSFRAAAGGCRRHG